MQTGDDQQTFAVKRPKCVISIGVTGHRLLGEEESLIAARSIAAVLSAIDSIVIEGGLDLVERRLLTTLAAGADQIAAEACPPGWAHHIVLPFDRASYRATLGAGLQDSAARRAISRFDQLLASANRCLELADTAAMVDPDATQRYVESLRYLTANRIIIAQSGLMVAVWHGGPPRGPGGTADAVAEALASRCPVLRIDPVTGKIGMLDPDGDDVDLLWRVGHLPDVAPDAALLRDRLAPLVAGWRNPSPTSDWAEFERFTGEGRYALSGREQITGLRRGAIGLSAWFNWFLLLGVSESRRPTRNMSSDALTKEWETATIPAAITSTDAALAPASIAADTIATVRASAYRSGYTATFLGATLAVLIGLLGLADERQEAIYVSGELAVLIATIALFAYARQNRFHGRWLNSRYIAELLRGQRASAWLGFSGRRPAFERRDWPMWLADAILALPGIPDAAFDRPTLALVAAAMRTHLVDPQIDYHRLNAVLLSKLHRRLDRLGWTCVLFALLAASTFVVVAARGEPPTWLAHLVTIVCASAPLVAAAAAGIRFQGDFERFGDRSNETTHALETIAGRLKHFVARASTTADQCKPLLFEELYVIAQALSAVLQADSEDWRFVYAARPLPGVG